MAHSLRFSAVVFVISLAIIFAYAVFRDGGVDPVSWDTCLVALALLTMVFRLSTSRADLAPPMDRWLLWLLVLLPGYAVLQIIPLPVSLLKILSPARAELVNALAPISPGIQFASISVAPLATLNQLSAVIGYTLVFLLVRQLSWRLVDRTWLLAFPITAVAALEALLGLIQHFTGNADTPAVGTYVNRNHFAGLLEMALPFPIMYTLVVARRIPFHRQLSLQAAVRVCLAIASAILMMVAVIYSFSRMGVIAAFSSVMLLLMAAMSFIRPKSVLWSRRSITIWACIVVVAAVFIMFVIPEQLIARFGELSSIDQITSQDRYGFWKDTLHLIGAYPVFGCGFGAYQSALNRYRTSAPLYTVEYAHNDYLQVFAELGCLGFVIPALLILIILARAVRAASAPREPEGQFLALACAAAMFAILLHSLADFNLYINANAFAFAWIMGMAAGLNFSARSAPAWKLDRVPDIIEVQRH